MLRSRDRQFKLVGGEVNLRVDRVLELKLFLDRLQLFVTRQQTCRRKKNMSIVFAVGHNWNDHKTPEPPVLRLLTQRVVEILL